MRALSEHAVFIFLLQFAVLLAAGRLLGAVAARFRQPSVLGELMAGILLGPAILGHIWPGGHAVLFPREQEQEHLLEMLSWIGMILLILRTGLEVDLRFWKYLGKAALFTSLVGIVIPFSTGIGLGRFMPQALIGSKDRTVFAIFLATAMSISAVKVIAKTLLDLKLMRRDVGAVILAASITDDTIGWILLAIVSSIATSGSVSVGHVLAPLGATALVIGGSLLVGRGLFRKVISWAERARHIDFATVSAIMVLTFLMAALTQKLGIHAVFGAFVAGVLVTQSPRVRQATLDALDSVILGVFAPIFFVYTGLKVATLSLPPLWITALILGVAIVGKVVGGGLGARLGGMRWGAALAVGIGMSSRGSMELVVARIGMDLGVLTPSLYAAIVLIPIFTSFTTPVLLRMAVDAIKPEPAEAQRLEQQVDEDRALIRREGPKLLVALSGGVRSAQALRMAAPLARLPGATLVAVSVVPETRPEQARPWHRRAPLAENDVEHVLDSFAREEKLPDLQRRIVNGPSPVAVIQDELQQGYDVIFVGAGRRRTVSNRILSAAMEEGGPSVVVLSGESFPRKFQRILLATDGGFAARGAAELAILYASASSAQLHALSVIEATGPAEELRTVRSRVVNEVVELGARSSVRIEPRIERSQSATRTIIEVASSLSADLLLLGAVPQVLGRRTFLGNTPEAVLRDAPCPVALFIPGLARARAKVA
jgi:Kef-type K+ transport system membrane component KefB/nucleotide-binding universal stress UspA family protein